MNIHVPAGTYIAAVSGGVDSVALLHMLSLMPEVMVIVAHVDHGIRSDSASDAAFVSLLAKQYGCVFESTTLELGAEASENTAREARYAFLTDCQHKHRATGVITAHHQGDVIETAMINLIRGTGRRGLTALESRPGLLRPLLQYSKQDIVNYATKEKLAWVEDSTNAQNAYLRNRLRNTVIASASEEWKAAFLACIHAQKVINTKLDHEVNVVLSYRLRGPKAVISRSWFTKLDHALACEFMYAVLRRVPVENINALVVQRLVVALKVAKIGSKHEVDGRSYALITKRSMRFVDKITHKTLAVYNKQI